VTEALHGAAADDAKPQEAASVEIKAR
jgi:hypothetical protein